LNPLQKGIVCNISLDFKTCFDQYKECHLSIPWHQLQTTLINVLPPELLKINNYCVNLEKESDYIKVSCYVKCDQRLLIENENRRELKKFNGIENKKFKTKSIIAVDEMNLALVQVIYENKKLG
jgi:hypothetical protein